jgi:hypothetical protein
LAEAISLVFRVHDVWSSEVFSRNPDPSKTEMSGTRKSWFFYFPTRLATRPEFPPAHKALDNICNEE